MAKYLVGLKIKNIQKKKPAPAAPLGGAIWKKWINNMMSSGQDFTISLIDNIIFRQVIFIKIQEIMPLSF